MSYLGSAYFVKKASSCLARSALRWRQPWEGRLGEHPSREGAIGVRIEPELSGGQPPWISRTFDRSWAT